MTRAFACARSLVGGRTLAEAVGGRDNNYNLIRLLLASSVIYAHSFALSGASGYKDLLSEVLWPVTTVGGLAVKLFFFLSGLFVAQSFQRDPSLLGFVSKRFLRIWPGYFACLLSTALLLAALTGQASLWRYLGFSGLYEYVLRNSVFDLTWRISGVLEGHRFESLNGSIHTLPMELKMYGVLALLGAFGLLRTRTLAVLAGLLAIGLALSPEVLAALPFKLFDADWSLVAGILFLAGVVVHGLAEYLRPAAWQGAMLLPLMYVTDGILHQIALYAFAVWAMLWVGQSRLVGRLWRPRDDLSYGIYIYGWPCQQMVLAIVSTKLNPYLLTVLALPLAALFAAASWRWIEKPAIGLGRDLVAKRSWSILHEYRVLMVPLVVALGVCCTLHWAVLRWDLVPVGALPVRIIDFGPRQSRSGEPINQQPHGGSAIWLKLDGDPGRDAVVVMAQRRLRTQVSDGLATAGVPDSVLAKPGGKEIVLERRYADRIERSNVVVLEVLP